MHTSPAFRSLRNKKVLITAGPTREYWDPVRYLTNGSSGQMGLFFALEAARLGARVVLISGSTAVSSLSKRKNVRIIPVVSALDMEREVRKQLSGTDIFVSAAAVSDYRPAIVSRHKIKGKPGSVTLKLVRNPDIISHVARSGPNRPALVVGFALETRDVLKNAHVKLRDKNLDWIVANRNTNMGSSRGSVTLLSRWQHKISIPSLTKERLAKEIWRELMGHHE